MIYVLKIIWNYWGAAIGTYRPQYRPLSAIRYLDANPLPTRNTLFSTLVQRPDDIRYLITIAFPMFGETGQIIFRHIGEMIVYKLVVSTVLVFSIKTLFIRLYRSRGIDFKMFVSPWCNCLVRKKKDVIALISVKVSFNYWKQTALPRLDSCDIKWPQISTWATGDYKFKSEISVFNCDKQGIVPMEDP
jgi:hypothetical protein